MSKEELLKYLIAEIDLIMHDKDYRFENANGTWYSRESCRDLTNEEVFEELRTELRQFADLEAKLAESEKKAYSRGHSQRDIANEIKLNALREDVANKEKRIVELKQQLTEKEKEIESYKHFKITIGTMENNQVDISSTTYTDQDKISFAVEQLEKVKEFCNNPKNRVEYEYCPNAWTYAVDKDKLMLEIDNQIKQLKEKNNG